MTHYGWRTQRGDRVQPVAVFPNLGGSGNCDAASPSRATCLAFFWHTVSARRAQFALQEFLPSSCAVTGRTETSLSELFCWTSDCVLEGWKTSAVSVTLFVYFELKNSESEPHWLLIRHIHLWSSLDGDDSGWSKMASVGFTVAYRRGRYLFIVDRWICACESSRFPGVLVVPRSLPSEGWSHDRVRDSLLICSITLSRSTSTFW